MWRTNNFLPALVAKFGPQIIKRISLMLLVSPLIAVMIICGIYIAYWRTDPLIRFIHMLCVLGLWMAGTVAIFASILMARLKFGLPIPVLVFAFLAISLAIYFTPLPRFTTVFTSQTGLTLAAAVGSLSIMTS